MGSERRSLDTGRSDRLLAGSLLAASFALRLVWLFRYRVNTDEPQHLHVAWGYTQGLVPYRDFFDNHPPLFHLLAAPLVAAVGERPWILFAGRLAILLVGGFALWTTYEMGRRLFSPRIALWGVVLVSFFPDFAGTSMEFRPDLLATAFSLAALAIVLRPRLDAPGALAAGLFAGAALATSLKSGVLFAGFGLAGLIVFRHLAPARRRSPEALVHFAMAGAAGACLVPGIILIGFAAIGATGALFDGVFRHNAVAELGLWQGAPLALLGYVAGLLIVDRVVPRVLAVVADAGMAASHVSMPLGIGLYAALLALYGPLNTSQSLLPVYAVLGPFAAALFDWKPSALPLAGAVAAIGGTALLLAERPIWQDHARHQTLLLEQVLELTDSGDFVLDQKGASVFRRRPVFEVYEEITRERIRLGLLGDDAPERLVATRTFLVGLDHEAFPPRARQFLSAHYVSVGRVRVLGGILKERAGGPTAGGFEIVVPGDYAIISDPPGAAVAVDGLAPAGRFFLAGGLHRFEAPSAARVAILWQEAAARGATPF